MIRLMVINYEHNKPATFQQLARRWTRLPNYLKNKKEHIDKMKKREQLLSLETELMSLQQTYNDFWRI